CNHLEKIFDHISLGKSGGVLKLLEKARTVELSSLCRSPWTSINILYCEHFSTWYSSEEILRGFEKAPEGAVREARSALKLPRMAISVSFRALRASRTAPQK